MIHFDITSEWVYEHYYIYLHLSIADSENIISDSDLEAIRAKIFSYMDDERGENLIKEVLKEFRSHSETERRDFIKDNASRFLRTDTIRQKVICDLEKIASGDEDGEEQVMFRYIRKVINNI
ncbi:hypothetical protein RCC89_13940 [Cytophagaceae bacterium ABcell3]|nr:hypothetical protein RCC89_13940 [Cytophagaceae bacterium ABcell3]